MEKNTIVPIYLDLWDTTTNTYYITADDSANMSMQASKGGAQCTAGGGAFAEILSSAGAHIGLYKYTPTQTEMNDAALAFRATTTTANLVLRAHGFYTQVMRGTDSAALASEWTHARALEVDNLDVVLSTRATPAQAAAALTGTAFDTTTFTDLMIRLRALFNGVVVINAAAGTATFQDSAGANLFTWTLTPVQRTTT